ncbi:MAG TPA: hypothetical protein ENL07_10180, partial [Chlorobaculum parvum]|nr:hypothetical protein [Chlorobaculum parvum]
MGTIDDYRTGKVVEGIRKAESVLDSRSASTDGDPVFEHICEKIVAFKPVWISAERAVELIRQSEILAVGERASLPRLLAENTSNSVQPGRRPASFARL